MDTELKKQAKNNFEKYFFKLMVNSVFGKTMENITKHKDIKLSTIDKRRNQIVSEPNYHTTKWLSKDLLAIEIKKYENNAKLCYMDTDSFFIYIKTEDVYKGVTDDV